MRTALVGGGASGIGRATAEHLVRAGYQVVLTGRRAEALEAAAAELTGISGRKAHWLVNDITRAGTAEHTVSQAEELYGPLDAVVLNAGGPPPGNILEVQDEQWYAAVELLLLGPVRLARLVLPGMAERGFGRLVFVTSSAVRQPQPDLAPSVVLRSAVTAAAKLLSREYAASGVTVNCVAPGPTATDRRAEILTARARASGRPYQELDDEDTATVPAGRSGEPAEIAAAIAFLASPEASYVNGTVLTVDGGRTETI
jgi:3-oxoacyl-[acyl-carrier protein] reductase